MKRKNIMRSMIVLAFVLGLVGSLAACGHKIETEKELQVKTSKVKVQTVAVRDIRQIYKTPGTVRSMTIAPLSSKVMGTVLEVKVRVGDHVKAGQLLAVIDSRESEAMVKKSEAGIQEAQLATQQIDKEIEAAQANLQLASLTLKRYQDLSSQKSVSPQEFDEVQTRQRAAQASWEGLQAKRQQVLAKIQQAQADLSASHTLSSYAQIQSPMNGVVSERRAEPGSLAVPGTPLLIVEETERYRLEVSVEESRIAQIKTGESVPLEISPLHPSRLQGKVSEIQPAADPYSRTYLVKIALPAHPMLRSGMYGEALFATGFRKGIWILPQSIVRQGQLEGVYVVEKDNSAWLRLLKLGATTDTGVEVLSGLGGGEEYVVEGLEALRDGSHVEAGR